MIKSKEDPSGQQKEDSAASTAAPGPPKEAVASVGLKEVVAEPRTLPVQKPVGRQVTASSNKLKIRLDSYDKVFDDFDDSPIGEGKGISDDLIDRLKKMMAENPPMPSEKVLVEFSIDPQLRNRKIERMVAESLQKHFMRHHHDTEEKYKSDRKRGILMVAMAPVLDALIAPAIEHYFGQGFIPKGAANFTTLAAYGLFFFGIEGVIDAFKIRRDDDFYRRVSDANISFKDRPRQNPEPPLPTA